MLRTVFTLFIFSLVSFASGTTADFNYLKQIDIPHPFCEIRADLMVAGEYFVPVANDLPGVKDYNAIILLYQKKQWEQLDKKIVNFRKIYETSPLLEPLTFLYAESLFERAPQGSTDLKQAEKVLREALLLYPKSEMAPVVSATAASEWLKRGMFERSLALYESARHQYPFHEVSCVFLMGLGEANFMLRNFKNADSALNLLLQKCRNARLRVQAQLRLADTRWNENRFSEAEAIYQNTLKAENESYVRHYPSAYYHLGELKYRKSNWKQAKYYFDSYLKQEFRDPKCVPWALKRNADIVFRSSASLETVVGAYLETRERTPYTDIGRFCHVRGLLLGLPEASQSEYERRVKVIDEELEEISDSTLKSTAFLEKGLLLLDIGKAAALDYLIRLNEKTHFNLSEGPIAIFVREKLLSFLAKEVDRVTNQGVPAAKTNEVSTLFQTFELAHSVWLKGTAFEKRGRRLFGNMVLKFYDNQAGHGALSQAFELMSSWMNSPLWDNQAVDQRLRYRVAMPVVRALANKQTARSVAELIFNNEKILNPFFNSEFSSIWVAAALELGDEEKIASWIGKAQPHRQLANLSPMPQELRSYLMFSTGKFFSHIKKYAEADQWFLRVKDPAFRNQVLSERFQMYQKQKNYLKAFQLGMQLHSTLETGSQPEHLRTLYSLVQDGKLWKNAPSLLKLSQKYNLSANERASYFYLAGLADYELKMVGRAISELEKAVSIDPQSDSSAEARFKLGKCYLLRRHSVQARKIWEELVRTKDVFWSPLARNELELLTHDMRVNK
ncbi:MAG: tetratricopeptide repeat protein [Deltaproteobacteria bacterium]|nr:tetratricopeptide repeat protein [Deltaproteobacteria bacterium]